MDINRIKKYADSEYESCKIAKAVTEVKNEIENKEGGRDIVMSDYFKTLRELLIEQQKITDVKQDKLIEQLKDTKERIVQATEYDPKKALTYEGSIPLPELDYEEPSHEYVFIDTDDESFEEDESSEEEPRTSTSATKVGILNLDKGTNDDYKTKVMIYHLRFLTNKKMLMI